MPLIRRPISREVERLFLVLLFILALGLRLLYLFEVAQSNPYFAHPTLDAGYHDDWAQSIAGGNLIGSGVFFRAPLYPYLLGFVYAVFGHDYFAARAVQHTLGALAVILIFFLGRRLFNRTVGALAALLAAFYPILIYFEDELLLDWLLVFLGTALFLLLYRAKEKPAAGRWLVAGLMFGFACITRPTFLPFFVCVIGWIFYLFWPQKNWPGIARSAILFSLGTATIIAPVSVRNWFVGHDFVLIASQGGTNFYIGNNPAADGHTSRLPEPFGVTWEYRDLQYPVDQYLGRPAKPSEVSDYWYREGWRFIRENPRAALQLTLKKFYLLWNKFEIPNNQNYYTFARIVPLFRWLPLGFWFVGPLGLLGLVLAWRAKRARLVALFVLVYTLTTVAFFVCDRFRVPLLPFLFIYAAYALVALFRLLQAETARSLVMPAALLALLILFANSNAYHFQKENPAQEWDRQGNLQLRLGRYREAEDYFRKTLEAQPDFPDAHLNWGVALWKLGRVEEAVFHFRREAELHKASEKPYANLSTIYRLRGQSDSAIVFARQAIQRRPYAPAGYLNLAQAYEEKNDLVRAESTLTAGQARCGGEFTYGNYLLAGVLYQQGKFGLASAAYRPVLKELGQKTRPAYDPESIFGPEGKTKDLAARLEARAWYGLGASLGALGQLDSAITAFKRALVLWPGFADAQADLGVAFQKQGMAAEAIEALQKAIALDPGKPIYYYNLGVSLATTGRREEARKNFQKTLELDPSFQPARVQLQALR